MAKLKNLKKQVRVFNLETPYFLAIEGENGAGKPESLTLLPLETRDVPDEALACREVRSALQPAEGRPTLRVVG